MTESFNTIAFIPGLGAPEAMLIFVVVLLLFGAKKLPELARGLGKSMNEFKKARTDFEMEVQKGELEAEEEAAAPKPKKKKAAPTKDQEA